MSWAVTVIRLAGRRGRRGWLADAPTLVRSRANQIADVAKVAAHQVFDAAERASEQAHLTGMPQPAWVRALYAPGCALERWVDSLEETFAVGRRAGGSGATAAAAIHVPLLLLLLLICTAAKGSDQARARLTECTGTVTGTLHARPPSQGFQDVASRRGTDRGCRPGGGWRRRQRCGRFRV